MKEPHEKRKHILSIKVNAEERKRIKANAPGGKVSKFVRAQCCYESKPKKKNVEIF